MKITDVRTFLYTPEVANRRFGPILFVRVDTDVGNSCARRQILRMPDTLAGKRPDTPPVAGRHVAKPGIPATPTAAWPT